MSLTLIALSAVAALAAALPRDSVMPAHLRCEYLNNPQGIDVPQPRLSWNIQAEQRGWRQTAFQILVAASPEKLAADTGDCWNSGKVTSDQCLNVNYAGKPLASRQRYWWKVRVWDKQGKPSAWSEPAQWTMGILSAAEWGAQWIGYRPAETEDTRARAAHNFNGCRWIWFPESVSNDQAPAGTRYFRRGLAIPEGAAIRQARVLLTADDQFTLTVNGKPAAASDGEPFAWQRPQHADLKELLHPGRNVLAISASNNAAGPAGILLQLTILLEDGRLVEVRSDATWRCADKESAGWQDEGFNDESWVAAQDLGEYGMAPWRRLRVSGDETWAPEPAGPLLRKQFTVSKPVADAQICVCGLGYYELRLNGAKVGDHVLDPAFTRFDRRCLYVAYDVTAQLRQGANALGVLLGNGFYNQHSREEWDFDRAVWRDRPKLLVNLRVRYRDGSVQTVVSDASWRAVGGPVVHDGIRNGEEYDARREKPGWDRPGYDDRDWDAAAVVSAPKGSLHSQVMPPIKVTETLAPKAISEPRPGVFIFDMGQNFAGWAQLRVSGPAGARVTMRYGERLTPDGMLTREQIQQFVYQGPFQTDVYILKGEGEEVWEPRFSYHGFRYVEVTGFPGKPTLDNLRGRVVHTAFPSAGSFTCSNPLLNDIQRLTLWSYRSNFPGYPTDCPQREKNGWTGDAHLAAEQAMYNWENTAAYEKWLNDLRDEQRENGEFPGIVPTSGWGYGIGPSWDSVYLLIPWYLYQYRDDTRMLRAHYPGMKRYVDYLTSRAQDGIVDYGLGDWVPAKTVTPVAVTSTAYYYVDARIVAQTARILGNAADAEKYAALAEQIKAAFRKKFIQADGAVANGSQTAQSCALHQDLATAADRAAIFARLLAAVEAEQNHLDTGILGAKYLFRVLSEQGRADLAYQVATQTTAPSYGAWLKQGATTLWEDWRGAASLNHIMFGDISAWFYQTLAGIQADPEHPGFKHFFLRPQPVGDLRFVEARTESPYGEIASAWRIEDGQFRWKVTIPANTTATLAVPVADASRILEGGKPVAAAEGLRFLRQEGNTAVFHAGSGAYHFTAPWPEAQTARERR